MRIVITGANRGIGLEFARQLSGQGHHIIATARHPDRAEALQQLTQAHPDRVRVLTLDASDADSVSALAAKLGEDEVDWLIHNAGVYPRCGALGELDYDAMRQGFEVNTLGPLRVVEALLPALRRAERGRVALLTSQMGSIADNKSGGAYAYRVSKAALNMAAMSLSRDLAGEDIPVTVLHPGWVQTDMGGANAQITPEQSVGGMIEVITGLTLERTGSFLSWQGETLPW